MLVTVQVVDGKARRHDLFHLGIELPVDLAVIEFPLAGPLDDFRITFRQQAVGLDQGRYFLGRQDRRQGPDQAEMDADAQFRTLPGQVDGLVKSRAVGQQGCTGQDTLSAGFDDGLIDFCMDAEIIGINDDSIHLANSPSFQDVLHNELNDYYTWTIVF